MVEQVSLEDLVLAYMGRAASLDRAPSSFSVVRP
jgi:hypothetical protein